MNSPFPLQHRTWLEFFSHPVGKSNALGWQYHRTRLAAPHRTRLVHSSNPVGRYLALSWKKTGLKSFAVYDMAYAIPSIGCSQLVSFIVVFRTSTATWQSSMKSKPPAPDPQNTLVPLPAAVDLIRCPALPDSFICIGIRNCNCICSCINRLCI